MHRDAPVAHHEADQAPAKISTQPVAINKRENAPGANRAGHGGIEGRRIGCRRNGGQRPGVEQAERVQQLKPEFCRKDGEVGGVIEELLRLAVVENERVVDHHEIHVGVAPVDQRVTEQEERYRKAGDDRRQSPAPAEEVSRSKASFAAGDCGSIDAAGVGNWFMPAVF